MSKMQLRSGKWFDLREAKPENIRITDIAYALSNIARFNGHAKRSEEGYVYTVAQHSVLVSHLCDEKHALEGLMHDAHEAYTQDVISPIKQCVEGYGQFEDKISAVVRSKYCLPLTLSKEVKRADLLALREEVRTLLQGYDSASIWFEILKDVRCVDAPLELDSNRGYWLTPWDHCTAEANFIQRYRELTE